MKKKNPTIEELEEILNGPPGTIRINPDGSLEVIPTKYEDEYEREKTRCYQVGISAGLKMAGESLLEFATEKFKIGEDNMASLLRTQAKEFFIKAEEEHPGPPK